MKTQALFIIILKVIGILLIKDIIVAVPPVLDALIEVASPGMEDSYFLLAFPLLALGFYCLMVYLLLFRTASLVKLLRLTRELDEEILQFSLHKSAVYTIAFIVAGLTILVMYIPGLIREIQIWLEHISTKYSFYSGKPFSYYNLAYAIARVLIGVFLIIYHPALINFIESKRRSAVLNEKALDDDEQLA